MALATTTSTTWVPPESFGERLRRVRRHMGWSQQEMAEHLDVPLKRYSNWEGSTSPRHLADLARHVQEITGADARWLVFGDGGDATTRQNADWDFHFLDAPLPFDLAEAS